MKKTILLILLALPLLSQAQKIGSLSDWSLIAKNEMPDIQGANYKADTHTLQIGEWLIPVVETTDLKVVKTKTEYQVEFFLQEGTSIRSASDVSLKKAWLALPFYSKSKAKQFVTLFKKELNHL